MERLEKSEVHVVKNKEVENNSERDGQLESDLMALTKRVDKNEANTMENIKDINLINKELSDLKRLIDGLKNQVSSSSNAETDH